MDINKMMEMLKNPGAMQAKASAFQQELTKLKATGSSGAGLVKLIIKGSFDIESIEIAEEAMKDKELLQDLIISAHVDAITKLKEEMNAKITANFGTMPISPFGN